MVEKIIVKKSVASKIEENNYFLLLPTAAGLFGKLSKSYSRIALSLCEHGYSCAILEFPGQMRNEGRYSVYDSCEIFTEYISKFSFNCKIYVFGICTGALAAIYASNYFKNIGGIISWEMSPRYNYSIDVFQNLEKKFDLKINWNNCLVPVQPIDLVRGSHSKVFFGYSNISKCTNLKEQEELKTNCINSSIFTLNNTSHIPGIPTNSEYIFITKILDICKENGEY